MKVLVAAFAAFVLLTVAASAADTPLTVASQTATTITFSYQPVAGAAGYRYFADGVAVARTFDPARSTVKFSKGASSYRVSVLDVSERADGFVYPAPVTPPPPPPGCDLNATTATFSSQIGAASAGQTVCLATGNYGIWGGTNKTVTVKAAAGATPQMQISLGSGDAGFTLDGMTGMGGAIGNGVVNVTVRNSQFTGPLNISGSSTDGIVLDGNTHNWNVGPSSGGPNAKIYLENSLTGTLNTPSVTIRNSQIKNGDLDGIHFGGGSGYQILNNTLDNLCDRGANHTDNMQFDTSVTTQVRIAGNYVHAGSSCGTQGISSYDHGTNGVIIENNVVDIRRPWGIELYADVNSTVRHNTIVYYPAAQCSFNIACGKIDVTAKSGAPASTGTQVYDNLAVAGMNCNQCSAHHNVPSQNAVYVGPTTVHDGFMLSPSSPVGRGAASDGTDAGVYAAG